MKIFSILIFLTVVYSVKILSQFLPHLPIPISYASAEVWGDSIYFFWWIK
ncbi:MAG: hypothetical protein KatS3mg036_0115 [Ignavibacterium sp.]|nr:MAG: hypothetical protein KatS3mg036_0115 [Ignavibacterium sp.]